MITERARVRRLPARASYDRNDLHAVLDEGLVCHVGFSTPDGPVVIPTNYGRDGDVLYIHGATTSRMLRELPNATSVCVTVTLLDGLVFARSIFHHSMNYRSAVVFGRATLVTDDSERMHGLEVISERVMPGRWREVRPPSEPELRATAVVKIAIEEFSVKSRSGPPGDEAEDLALPVWAGVLPVSLEMGSPVADEHAKGKPVPDYIAKYTRKR